MGKGKGKGKIEKKGLTCENEELNNMARHRGSRQFGAFLNRHVAKGRAAKSGLLPFKPSAGVV